MEWARTPNQKWGLDDALVMAELERIARERYDGHFSVLRFTTNWRVCFTTPDTALADGSVLGMAEGKTFAEAATAAIMIEAESPGCWHERLDEASKEAEAHMAALMQKSMQEFHG